MGALRRQLLVTAAAIALPMLPVGSVAGGGAHAGAAGAAAPPAGVAAAAEPGSFVGLTPARLADSRPGATTIDGTLAGGDAHPAGSITTIPVTGRAGIPTNATAATLNITVTQPTNDGYATIYPCGTQPPNASNLNYATGQTIANAATVKLGTNGTVCVYVSTTTQLIVDIGGYFPAGSAFTGLAPARLADSRPGATTIDGTLAGGDAHPAGSITTIPVTGRAGIPTNATAATLNITVTQPTNDGYATIYPCGTQPPNASNLNYATGQTIANAATVKLGTNGTVCVYVSTTTQLIVDIGGYFPAGSAFTGLAPARLADSRPGATTIDGTLAGGDAHPAGSITTIPVTGRAGIPTNATAATLNITVTQPTNDGYATIYPCGTQPPNASNLNYATGQTIANAATVKLGTNGTVCVYVSTTTQLIVDIGGYFPAGSAGPPPSSVPPDPIAFNADEVFSLDSPLSNYWIYVPGSYDASHQTPTTLFVWLHGCGGQSEFDIYTVSPGGDQDWISIAVGGREGDCWDPAADGATVKAAIADVKSHFNVDPKAVVLGGFSSGGDLAYRTAFYDAGAFAGVLAENTSPFRDTGSSQDASLAAASWKFNVVHLAHLQDTTYPIDTVRAETDAMIDAGFPVTRIERVGTHYDDPGTIVDGQAVPGTDADLVNLLLPHLHDGWRAP